MGAPLFEIDSDAQGTASKSAAPTSEVKQPEVVVQPATPSHSHTTRTPSIKFLGKRSLLPQKKCGVPECAAKKAIPLVVAPVAPKKIGNGVDFTTLRRGAFYGRPELSSREVDAILSGGATAI